MGDESRRALAGAAIILCLVGTERKCTLKADLSGAADEDGNFELANTPPGLYAVFYDPSGSARAGWKETNGLEISLKIEGVALFSGPERVEFYSSFGGGESIGISPHTSIGFDAEGDVTGDGSFISEKYGLTLQVHDGQPLIVQIQPGEITEVEIMAWGL